MSENYYYDLDMLDAFRSLIIASPGFMASNVENVLSKYKLRFYG